MNNTVIDISRLADYLNLHASIIHDLVRKNLIPHHKVDSVPVFDTRDIEQWIEKSRVPR